MLAALIVIILSALYVWRFEESETRMVFLRGLAFALGVWFTVWMLGAAFGG